ncbi:MAG: hypothetical protein EOP10_08895 [Proteobacteria bacterium]|nr:MAG: hypothetical protein EOP10_08895 [Pseudomonadota bacterium]
MTGHEHDLKTKSPTLQALLRSLSKLRFENISGRTVDLVKDHPNPDDFVYGSHQTVIQIASKDLRITFKSHFTVSNTQTLLKKKLVKGALKPLYDLFMEYSNLVAGGVSQQLHASDIVSGISLPMATSGFDELIASDVLRSTSYFDYWMICGEGFCFTCTAMVDILEGAKVENLTFTNEEETEDGGLEFL